MTDGADPVDAALGEVAAKTGATVRRAPRAGREVRRMYVVPPERVGNLVEAMGGGGDDDVLALLAGRYQRTQGRIGDLLRRPEGGSRVQQLAQLTLSRRPAHLDIHKS